MRGANMNVGCVQDRFDIVPQPEKAHMPREPKRLREATHLIHVAVDIAAYRKQQPVRREFLACEMQCLEQIGMALIGIEVGNRN